MGGGRELGKRGTCPRPIDQAKGVPWERSVSRATERPEATVETVDGPICRHDGAPQPSASKGGQDTLRRNETAADDPNRLAALKARPGPYVKRRIERVERAGSQAGGAKANPLAVQDDVEAALKHGADAPLGAVPQRTPGD
jgi:hypothetical protein